MMRYFLIWSVIVGASLASASTPHFENKRQTGSSNVRTVNTTSGPVSGHVAPNATNVSEYLGIPYAKPPVDDLRFAPPEKYTSTTSVNGTDFGFSCLTTTAVAAAGGTTNLNILGANITAVGVTILSTLGQLSDKFGEDCLTLNVWVPSGGEEKKAVLLWIYGGGFSTGSTRTPEYNGQFLADQEDVVVVSINYRINIFGFPGNPSEPHLNLGLLDQRLAIEWTRDNIASFGGDPSRITIFGQSAGSASVDYYSYAYASDPIVAGLIEESGTLNGFGQSSAESVAANWFTVTAQAKCGNASSNSTDVLKCMRTKTPIEILSSMPKSDSTRNFLSTFGPAVDNITVFGDYPARSSAGNFAKVPLLIGNTDNEGGLFRAVSALSNQTYPDIYWNTFNVRAFTCPAGIRANTSIEHDVPTWRYRWFGAFPNTALTTFPDSGAWHTSEVLAIFNTWPSGNGLPNSTAAEVEIGKYIRGAWAAFAKDPKEGLKNYGGGWPTYEPAKDTLVRLGYQNATGLNVASPGLYDVGCNVTVSGNGTGSGGNGSSATPTTSRSASGTPSASASTSPPASTSAVPGEGTRFGASLGLVFLAAVGVAYLV